MNVTDTGSRETEVVEAVADTIVARTDIPPRTTLSAPASPGDLVLHVVSVAGFQKQGHLKWFDDTGETMAGIKAVDTGANTITLDYAGYAEHGLPVGLVEGHQQGALVATNLMLHRPISISPMLRTGLPVVAIWPRHKRRSEFTFGSTLGIVTVRIQVHLALQQFDSAPMNAEAYNEMQQESSRQLLTTIENALDNNRHLMSRYNAPGNHANGLGDGQSKQWSQSLWDTVVEEVDIPQAVGAMEVVVRPRRYVRSEQ